MDVLRGTSTEVVIQKGIVRKVNRMAQVPDIVNMRVETIIIVVTLKVLDYLEVVDVIDVKGCDLLHLVKVDTLDICRDLRMLVVD